MYCRANREIPPQKSKSFLLLLPVGGEEPLVDLGSRVGDEDEIEQAHRDQAEEGPGERRLEIRVCQGKRCQRWNEFADDRST